MKQYTHPLLSAVILISALSPLSAAFPEDQPDLQCPAPQNILIENVYDTRARISWTPGIPGTPAGWEVVYDTAGFTPGPGVGDSLYVTTPKTTLTGLQKRTRYDFYVRQDCGNDEWSEWSGPFTFETYRTNDVGISAVLTPVSGCDLGPDTVTVILTNYGANPQSLISFNFSVNGVPVNVPMPEDGFYTGVLGKDSSIAVFFETLYDFSAPGEYVIAAWTSMSTDEYVFNDTVYYYLNNRLEAPYAQDFEAWSGGWAVDVPGSSEASWQYGRPEGLVIAEAASGRNAWVTNLTGAYNPGEFSYLESPCFDFSQLAEDPALEFSLFLDIEANGDGAWLEMSSDDGATWTKLGGLNDGLNWYSVDNVLTGLGSVWSGSTGGWVTARHRLDDAAGQAQVRLRFAFGANGSGQREGIGIDNILIYTPPENDLAGISASAVSGGQPCGLEADAVIFQIANFGALPQSNFDVYYSLNGAAPVVENVGPQTLNPYEVLNYTFNQTFDSRDDYFNIRCWTSLNNDADPANDAASVFTVDHRPGPVPIFEDFEDGLPGGWATDAMVTDDHNNSSRVLAVNLYEFNNLSVTTLPRVGFIGPNDSLQFDYRITEFDTDGATATLLGPNTRFMVQAAPECGGTFVTLFTIDQSNHTPAVDLQTIRIPLGNYAGRALAIRFRAEWGEGDFFFDLDNINLRACPPDMQISAVTTPSAPGQSSGSATLEVGLGNPPYRYFWSNGDSTQTAVGLPAGVFTVTVIDDLGCTGSLSVQIGTATNVTGISGLAYLSLQPNPTRGMLVVRAALDRPAEWQLEVLDLLGRIRERHVATPGYDLYEQIDLGALPDGLYLIRLTANGDSTVRKVVKGQYR